jgi:protein involved in polysaccharide export with SLBB domain
MRVNTLNVNKMTNKNFAIRAAILLSMLTLSASVLAQGLDTRPTFSTGSGAASTGGAGVAIGTPQLRAVPDTLPSAFGARAGTHQIDVLPGLKSNDFQKFIVEATGRALPLFGFDFFENPLTPVQNVPVSNDYALGAGDEVIIRGWGSIDIDVKAVIDRNGQINIPKVGSIQLSGVKASQVTSVIRSSIGRYYQGFELSVTMGQLRTITLYVVGQARKPGAYNVSSLSTLVSGLFATGGPSSTGSLRKVQLKRANQTVAELDLYEFLAKGMKQGDISLQDGDVIVIPAALGYVALTGAVTTPAVYELKNDKESIGDLLALAGGMPVIAQMTEVKLERIGATAVAGESRSVESITLDAKGLKMPLRSGDMVFVPSLIPSFANAVTLRGNVSQPARLPWVLGMKIRDLIPSKESLVSAASIQKQNQILMTGAGAKDSKDSTDSLAGRIGNLLDEVNFEYAVVERINPKDLSVQLIPFNLGNALSDAKSVDNLLLQSRDVVTVFSVNDVRVPLAKRRVFVRVEGEVVRPGVYQMAANDTLQAMLDKAGGLTSDAYLYGSAFFREDVRRAQEENLKSLIRRLESESVGGISQIAQSTGAASDQALAQSRIQVAEQLRKNSLERLKTLKPSGRIALNMPTQVNNAVSQLPAIRLESGDRLVVSNRPDFVYVFGSINTESALLFVNGKTVSDYLLQAGLASGADRDNVILMRADGSALTNNSSWGNSVMRTTVMPGDSIVLPEKLDRESGWSVFTRNAKDITQIMYQFGLGVAAYKTLR